MGKLKLQRDIVIYLSSRIYAGYAKIALNPEPYAYDGRLAVNGLLRIEKRKMIAVCLIILYFFIHAIFVIIKFAISLPRIYLTYRNNRIYYNNRLKEIPVDKINKIEFQEYFKSVYWYLVVTTEDLKNIKAEKPFTVSTAKGSIFMIINQTSAKMT